MYRLNYYKIVVEKGRKYYELYTLPRSEEVPESRETILLSTNKTVENAGFSGNIRVDVR